MISAYDLRRGDLFRIPGYPVIFEFDRMDGMYVHAHARDGTMVVFVGNVELV
ncbi:MAG TPA: hypothetical protein VKY62_04060 [Devosia sp.]|nr:hypothetical protein [Devosia sp.]